jgi:hypothetical protein
MLAIGLHHILGRLLGSRLATARAANRSQQRKNPSIRNSRANPPGCSLVEPLNNAGFAPKMMMSLQNATHHQQKKGKKPVLAKSGRLIPVFDSQVTTS